MSSGIRNRDELKDEVDQFGLFEKLDEWREKSDCIL